VQVDKGGTTMRGRGKPGGGGKSLGDSVGNGGSGCASHFAAKISPGAQGFGERGGGRKAGGEEKRNGLG